MIAMDKEVLALAALRPIRGGALQRLQPAQVPIALSVSISSGSSATVGIIADSRA
jgi:hypothetical protein